MATNRYSNGTVAKFNPLSFQELSAAPLMQRQKHDQLIAQQEMLRQGLAKVDPLDVHMNEALNVKSGIENKLRSQAELLSKEGINPNTQGEFLALNREYQNLVSPTGRLGQINAAKQVYAKNFNDYLEDAQKTKGWSRERALANWNKFSKQYTGFEGDKISNIGQLGAPKYIDVAERVQNYAKEAGMTSQEFARSSGALSFDSSGNRFVVNSNSKNLTSSNVNQLNQVAQLLNRELSDPNSEVRRSVEFDEQNPNTVMQNVISQLGIYKDVKTSSEQGRSVGSVDWKKTDETDDSSMDLEAVNVEGVNITKNSDLLSKLNGTGGIRTRNKEEAKKEGNPLGGSVFRIDTNNKDEVLNSQEYKNLARGIARTQKLGNDLKSPIVQNAVKKYLNENKDVTVQNRYVDPNTSKQGMLFASKELTGKDSKEKAGNLILERVRRGAFDMVDEEGNKIDKNDVGNFDFVYSGDMTPKSQIGKKGKGLFTNPKQNIGARTGVLVDKETGESKTVYVSRSSNDFDTPQFKAMETINGISKIADVQPGIYHKVKAPLFQQYGLKNVEVKYNKNKNTYNLSYTDNDGTNVDQEFPDEKFQEFILNAHGGIK